MKVGTLRTLKGLLYDLKLEALRAGHYPGPYKPGLWEKRNKRRAFHSIGYNQLVRWINALTDVVVELERKRDDNDAFRQGAGLERDAEHGGARGLDHGWSTR